MFICAATPTLAMLVADEGFSAAVTVAVVVVRFWLLFRLRVVFLVVCIM